MFGFSLWFVDVLNWLMRCGCVLNQITSNATLAEELQRLYGDIENLDFYVGGLAEDSFTYTQTSSDGSSSTYSSLIGELFSHVSRKQFDVLITHDKLWHSRVWTSPVDRQALKSLSSLHAMVQRHTNLEIPPQSEDGVFFA